MANLLHHSRLRAKGSNTDRRPDARAVLFLHGILGQGINWRGVARRLVAAAPGFEAVLVDLRAHGESLEVADGADTLAQAAADVSALIDTLDVQVEAVVGHSFGGKVALALAAADARLKRLVSIDSLPGERPDRKGSEGTVRVLEMLEGLPERFDDRAAFIAHIEGLGHRRPLAQWLAQSLAPHGDGGVCFGLDMRRIRALLDDYFVQDLWPVVEAPREGLSASLIVGGKSTVWSNEARQRGSRAAESHAAVRFAVLEEADHWVHVDDPEGLHALLVEALS